MSITRLQQARQMYAIGQRVAKTLDGSRPGYRGAGGYGDGSEEGANSGGGGSTGGDGPGPSARDQYMGTLGKTGPTSTSPKGDDAKLDYLTGKYQKIDLTKTQTKNFRDFQKQVGYSISPSSRPRNRVLGGLLSMFTGIPGLGYGLGKAMDQTAMGYGLGTGTTTDDDTGNGDGENREQYGAVGQYSGPLNDVVEGEGITTLVNSMPQNQFMSRYLQSQPEDIRQAIEASMQNYYTV